MTQAGRQQESAHAHPGPISVDRRRRPRDGESWIPAFCSPPVAIWCSALSQVILLFLLLAPTGRWPPSLAQVGLATLYVQWLCLVNLALLCLLRPRLARAPTPLAAAIMLVVVAGMSATGAAVAAWLQSTLALGALPAGASTTGVVGSSAAMAVLVAAAALRYAYVAAQWRQGVAASARAQFDALQARIRPHFLFNSMNTIAALIRTRPADAETAVEDLSDLFRAALRDDRRRSTLAEDVELARRYLAIEKLRLGPRLEVEADIPELPVIDTPPLLLQPLVENAVVHGIECLPKGGTLRLRLTVASATVTIEVHNPRPVERRPSRGTGTALDNIRRRLAFHFGDRARMEVDEGADYYAVRLHLPAA
jgi:two-component system sensor histidine kinase AlgZ